MMDKCHRRTDLISINLFLEFKFFRLWILLTCITPLQLLYQLFYHSANATTELDKPLNWTAVYKCILDWVALYHSLTDVVPTLCTEILLMPLLSWTRPTTELSSNGVAYFNTRSSVPQYCHMGHLGKTSKNKSAIGHCPKGGGGGGSIGIQKFWGSFVFP